MELSSTPALGNIHAVQTGTLSSSSGLAAIARFQFMEVVLKWIPASSTRSLVLRLPLCLQLTPPPEPPYQFTVMVSTPTALIPHGLTRARVLAVRTHVSGTLAEGTLELHKDAEFVTKRERDCCAHKCKCARFIAKLIHVFCRVAAVRLRA